MYSRVNRRVSRQRSSRSRRHRKDRYSALSCAFGAASPDLHCPRFPDLSFQLVLLLLNIQLSAGVVLSGVVSGKL